MAKILLVEDNKVLNKTLAYELQRNHYEVVPTFTAEEALIELKNTIFDLIILDLQLPKMSGFLFMQLVRKTSNIPIIVNTFSNSPNYRVNSIMLGANDYLVKPNSKDQILQSVKIVLDSSVKQNMGDSNRLIKLWDLEINLDHHTVKKDGVPIKLTSKEFEILRVLLDNPQFAFEKSTLFQIVWNEDYYPNMDNTINVHVKSIRKKLVGSSEYKLIETIWGYGYKLSSDVLEALDI